MRQPQITTISLDFETYSAADLTKCGGYVYAEETTTRVVSLAYEINGVLKLWLEWMPRPIDLMEHVANGGLLTAWNSMFEYLIWNKVCVPKYGWLPVKLEQMRCSMARARIYALPARLSSAGDVLQVEEAKDSAGTRLINLFSKPSKISGYMTCDRLHFPSDDLNAFFNYNLQDVRAEKSIAKVVPEFTDKELKLWLLDQKINERGVYIDAQAVDCFSAIVRDAEKAGEAVLRNITKGTVTSAYELKKIQTWLADYGIYIPSLQEPVVAEFLQRENLPPIVRDVLEIRHNLASASVKKLKAIKSRLSSDSRIRGLFLYYGANTGRFAGRGVQPQNLPNSGLAIRRCECGKTYAQNLKICPYCSADCAFSEECGWDESAFNDLNTDSIRPRIFEIYEKPIAAVASCLRSLFCASPGHDLICSDYSSIEAVVLATLAQEEWRVNAFQNGVDIYKLSASQMLGVPVENITKEQRRAGKVAELSSGYQGGIGAWKKMGADKFLSESEILRFIKLWRQKSPRIVNLWNKIFETAVNALMVPGYAFAYAGIAYQYDPTLKLLGCLLPSGRILYYHQAAYKEGQISYKFYQKYKTVGVIKNHDKFTQHTYGGKLVENIVQAMARDILCDAMLRVEEAGYPIVLHVHDEIVCEVSEGFGSLEEFETLMSIMPAWAKDYAVKAKGGWRGKRYKK
jgi:DNA polymerase bacteriophage-type